MINLLKNDFYRILKSKLLYGILIASFVFAFITAALYSYIIKMMQGLNQDVTMIKQVMNGRYIFASSFSMSNNIGLIVPIISSLFILSDINNGTLRNKITSGKGRNKIFLSHFITSSAFNVFVIVCNVLFNLFFSSLILGYGKDFDINEFIYILEMILLGACSYIFISSLITMLSLVCKNTPLTLISLVFIILIISFMSNIPSLITIPKKYENLWYLIPEYSLYSGVFSSSSSLSIECIILGILSLFIFSAIFFMVGIIFFKEKDIK